MLRAALLLVSLAGGVRGRAAVSQGALRPARGAVLALRGGGGDEPSDAVLQATYACNALSSTVLADAMSEVAALRKSVTSGEAVPSFGTKADELIGDAVSKFEADMPQGDAQVSAVYGAKAEELRSTLATSLEPVFTQQICLLKDGAHPSHPPPLFARAPSRTAHAEEASPLTCRPLSLPHRCSEAV